LAAASRLARRAKSYCVEVRSARRPTRPAGRLARAARPWRGLFGRVRAVGGDGRPRLAVRRQHSCVKFPLEGVDLLYDLGVFDASHKPGFGPRVDRPAPLALLDEPLSVLFVGHDPQIPPH